MRTLKTILLTLVRDERGGEVLEYTLVGTLIVMGALGVLKQVGIKALARWTSLNSSM